MWIIVISLLVTVIGIANSMLMSVTERFRDIGTMRCLGALSGFVRTLFLVEAAFMGVVGGAFGAVVSTFTDLILDIIGLLGGNPDFSTVSIGPIVVGPFINAVVSFLIVATIVYFGVIKPIDVLSNLRRKEEAAAAAPQLPFSVGQVIYVDGGLSLPGC